MWQHQSPSEQEGVVQSRGARGSTRALLSREAGFEAMQHGVASEPSQAGRRGPEPWGKWQHQSTPQQGGRVRSYRASGSARMHALLLVLA
jgi:hypothetical protein